MKQLKWLYIVALTALAVQAYAVPTLGVSWGVGVNTDPAWTPSPLEGSIPGDPGATVTPNGANQVTLSFPNGGDTPYVKMFTVDPLYGGDYTIHGPDLYVSFYFNPVQFAPNPDGGLQFYFVGNGHTWYATGLTTPTVTGEQFYSFTIGRESNWAPALNNPGLTWAQDFGSVSEIGFEVLGANQSLLQDYIFRDVQIAMPVPEPETIWIMAVVLASLMVTFRTRIQYLMGRLTARVHA